MQRCFQRNKQGLIREKQPDYQDKLFSLLHKNAYLRNNGKYSYYLQEFIHLFFLE